MFWGSIDPDGQSSDEGIREVPPERPPKQANAREPRRGAEPGARGGLTVQAAGYGIAAYAAPTGGKGERWEPAGKPGSVLGNHSSGTAVTDGLKQPTRKHRGPRHCFPIWSCSRWGLPCRSVLPPARCALTAPFHPYPVHAEAIQGRYLFCCTFRRLAPPRRYLAPCPVEPGLSSPPRLTRTERLPGRLPGAFSPRSGVGVKPRVNSAGFTPTPCCTHRGAIRREFSRRYVPPGWLRRVP